MNPINFQNRAIAYSVLAHIYDKATFASGPLDIFIPIVKNALSELYPSGTTRGRSISEIAEAIDQKFSIAIPLPVLNNILKAIAVEVNDKSNREDMRIFDDGSFWIEKFIFEDYSELIQKGKDDISKVVQIYKNFCKVYNTINDCNEVDLFKFIEQNRLDISFLKEYPKFLLILIRVLHVSVDSGVLRSNRLMIKLVSNNSSTFIFTFDG